MIEEKMVDTMSKVDKLLGASDELGLFSDFLRNNNVQNPQIVQYVINRTDELMDNLKKLQSIIKGE